MSNTIITSYADISGKKAQSDNKIVVFVNQDGRLSLEKGVLQSIIDEKKYENTSVGVVHIDEDGKPEGASDHSSDDDSIQHVNITVDAFYDPNACESFHSGVPQDILSELSISRESFLIGFQNDHCYTPLTSPGQKAHSQNNQVTFEEAAVGATDAFLPVQRPPIPSSKKITVLENKIISKGKKILNLNTVDGRMVLKGSDVLKKTLITPGGNITLSPNINKLETGKIPQLDNDSLIGPEGKLNISNEKPDDSSSESLPDDRDSDSDYHSLSKRKIQGKNVKPKTFLSKNVKKLLNKKLELKKNTMLENPTPEMVDQLKHGKSIKIKTFSKSRKIIGKKIKNTMNLDSGTGANPESKTDRVLLIDGDNTKDSIKQDLKQETPKVVKVVPKKDRKPPAHMTALLNDMTSLFSTPDVLRRVSTDSKNTPKTPDITKHPQSLLRKSDKEDNLSNPIPDKNVEILRNTKGLKPETKTYANTSSKALSKNLSRQQSTTSRDSLYIMSPLENLKLTQLFQDTNPGIFVNMSDDLGVTNKHEASDSLPVDSGILASPAALTGPLSPGLDMLALQPEDEGLSEDLLMHVAHLVQSSENLQEVIDKQVLGKGNDTITRDLMDHSIVPSGPPRLPEKILAGQVNVQRKEPIQIVRSNGRVITLPPIEAPATRSSKRKSLLNPSFVEQVTSPVAPAPVKLTTPATQAAAAKQAAAIKQAAALKQAVAITASSSASVSASVSAVTSRHTVQPGQKKSAKPADAIIPARQPLLDDEEALESDESWNSEDDPDRLWCICKQPHNNRFMICCDLCEDWFHGKCVNVTKAMGQEMEEKGVEWRCPNCLKKKAQTKTAFKPNSPRKSTDMTDETFSHLPADPVGTPQANTNCIVCKKAARASSIYCSDACILKHAQESLHVTTQATPTTTTYTVTKSSELKESPQNKSDARVIVYERKTGRCLAGPSAPTAANLKVWLQENPTFEVVRPGTISANKQLLNANKSKPKLAPKIQSILKIGSEKQIIIMHPPSKNLTLPNKPSPKTPISPSPVPKPQTPKQVTPKLIVKSPSTPKSTPQQKQTNLKSPTTPTAVPKKEEHYRSRSNSSEPIRENVRKALQEQISLRMAESKDNKFSTEEIIKFSLDTELELRDLFKDVGTKYKAKYRSLMFNLKDRKNLSLWQKICDRSLTPKQLVRLSPEELASQELAQWRDKEAKHQLELIKKSELDLLACNKTYVLKTHKGEEVMESRTTDMTELDPNVGIEDLVSALNNTGSGAGSISSSSRPTSPLASDRTHSSHHKHSKHKSKSHSKSVSHKRDHSSSRSKKSSAKRSSKDGKSSSRSHHRKTSRERDKNDQKRHQDSKREKSRKSSHSDSRRSKSTTRRRDSPEKKSHRRSRSRDNTRSKSKEGERSLSTHLKEEYKNRSLSKENDFEKNSTKDISIKLTKGESEHERKRISTDQGFVDDVTSITQDTKSIIDESEVFVPKDLSDNYLGTPGTPEANTDKILAGAESDQEPTSTVDSVLSSVWNGCVSMIDVAKFNITSHEVSGQCGDILQELGSELEIVGRISPEIVWDYLNKMKKQGNKEIVVIKLMATNEEEKVQYNVFFSYLNTRNRLGVVKVNGGGVKDFYIVPLTSHSPLPSVLLPLDGPGFEESRPHLLLGIIVRQRRKRSHASSLISSIVSKSAKLSDGIDRSYTPPPTGSYTPPSSPKRPALPMATPLSAMPLPSFLPSLSTTVKDKIAASLASADDDEPYSPGGSDSGSIERSPNSPPSELTSIKPTSSIELEKKMEELNRKIEEQKKQIQNMTVSISESMDEPYSPSRPMTPPTSGRPISTLSSISLPSNLHEILASIKNQTKTTIAEEVDNTTECYVPTAISVNPSGTPHPPGTAYYRDGTSTDVDMRLLNPPFPPPPTSMTFNQPLGFNDVPEKPTSKLSTLSEAELLSMVPDEELLLPPPRTVPPSRVILPPHTASPSYIKQKLDLDQPPPPGMEDQD